MTETEIIDLDVEQQDVNNTSLETAIWTNTIAGNTLGTSNAVRVSVRLDYLNNSGASRILTLRIDYGGVSLYDDATIAIPVDATNRLPMTVDFILFAKNATNVQGLGGLITLGTPGSRVGDGDIGVHEMYAYTPFAGIDGATDSTTTQDLAITVQHPISSTSLSVRRIFAMTELLAP